MRKLISIMIIFLMAIFCQAATRTWDYGAATGDAQTAANWSADTIPVADDTVIFDNTTTTGPSAGLLDSETGATAQCTYDLLHVKASCTYNIGSASEPYCCSPDKMIIEGSGTYYFLVGKDNQQTDTSVASVFVNNSDATVYLYSNANDASNTCDYSDVYVIAGDVTLAYYSPDVNDNGVYVSNLYLLSSNATVTIEKDAYKVNGTIATDVFMESGTLTCDSMLDTVDFYGGTLTYGTDLGGSPETDLNITKLRQYNGTFNWMPDDSGDDAYIGDLLLFGGIFNASSSTNNDRAKVLGNGAGNDIYLFSGATFNIANGNGNITIAASSQLWNFGATITTDNYTEYGLTYDAP